jgi:hypothetical protein
MGRAGLALDFVAVLVFVTIGRAVHAHGLTFEGIASTAWPFVVGLAIGSFGLTVLGLSEASRAGGLVVVTSTVAVGMVLRVVSHQGTAVAFVFVALGFLGAAMLGWRLLLALGRPFAAHHRLRRSSQGHTDPGR